jgi:hypothetical protein
MRYRMIAVGFLVVLAAIVVNTVQGINNANTIRATERNLSQTVKASAATRVTTVTQRCALTADVAAITLLDRNILLHFVPPRYGQAAIVAPYDHQLGVLAQSYVACEEQLATVKKINAHAP